MVAMPGQQTQPTYSSPQLVQNPSLNTPDFSSLGQGQMGGQGQPGQPAANVQMKDRNIIWRGQCTCTYRI